VGDQDRRPGGSAEHARNVAWRIRPELHAGKVERRPLDHARGALVHQHREATPLECRGHVTIVVVVPENGEDPVRRCQSRQGFRAGFHVLALAEADVVAAEHNEIGLLGHRKVDCSRDVRLRRELTVVQIGDQADSESGMLRRKTGYRQRGVDHPQSVPFVGVRIRPHTHESACSCGYQGLQHRPAGEWHSCI
jgi:hypothetical protein